MATSAAPPSRQRRSRFGEYNLPTRSAKALRDHGITPKNIHMVPLGDIEKVPGVGPVALEEIKRIRRIKIKIEKEKRDSTTKVGENDDWLDGSPEDENDWLDPQPAPEKKKRGPYVKKAQFSKHVQTLIDAGVIQVPDAAAPKPKKSAEEEIYDPMDDYKPMESTKQYRIDGDRLSINIGQEYGLRKRHIDWLNNVVENAPEEMGIPNVERLIMLLIANAYAKDPTKGGTRGVETAKGEEDRRVRLA